MRIVERLKNLWELSKDKPRDLIGGNLPGEPVILYPLDLANKQKNIKDVFIPRITKDPIKELVNENKNDN